MARYLISAVLLSAAGCTLEDPAAESLGDLERPLALEDVTQVDWMTRAAEAERSGAWEEAAYCLDRWLLGRVPDEEWFERRARAAEQTGDDETAARMRQELLKTRPDDVALRIDLADDLQRLGRGLEGAMLLEPLTHDPGTRIPALRALAAIHERDGRDLQAAEACERLAADERVPDREILWQKASRLREASGDVTAALEDMEHALQGVDLAEEEQRTLSRLRAFEIGEPGSVADAVALMTRHTNPDFRYRGAVYLTRGRFPGDVRVFGQALKDPDLRVARIAVRELGLRGAAEDAELLLPVLEHPAEEMRLAALRALGRLGSLEEVPVLLDRLDPADRAQFRAARSALEQITGESVGVELDPDAEQRERIRRQWRRWWEARRPGRNR